MQASSSIRKILFASTFTATSAAFAAIDNWLGADLTLNLALGASIGVVGSGAVLVLEAQLKKSMDDSMKTTLANLLAGNSLGILTLMGMNLALSGLSVQIPYFLQSATYVAATYLGYVFSGTKTKKQEATVAPAAVSNDQNKIILDATVLEDNRFADLAASGLLNKQLVLPSFIYKKILADAESENETVRQSAERSLENLEKLKTLPALDLVISETEDVKGSSFEEKLEALAQSTKSRIFTARKDDAPEKEGVSVIDLHNLAKRLKPLMQSGSVLDVKIQMYGKQPRQGVGFLDDGTMVVVNGGADFLGKSVKAFVLSEKPTSSGRMIFCNVMEDTTTRNSALSTSTDA